MDVTAVVVLLFAEYLLAGAGEYHRYSIE